METAHDKFDIEISYKGAILPFQIKIVDTNGSIGAEVWKEGALYFNLECCTDEVGDTLKISTADENKGIDPILVREIAAIIESEEE